jgi:hypothetical protein
MTTIKFELASRRVSKTSFDTKGDWGGYPPAIYTCPYCSGETRLTRSDLESAFDQAATAPRQKLLNWFKEWCPYFPRDWHTGVCPFRCSSCRSLVLLAFQASEHRGSGRHYWFTAIAEGVEKEDEPESMTPGIGSPEQGSNERAT